MQLDEQLRRSAGEREAGRAEQPHVRGRIELAQPFINILRRGFQLRLLAQREVDLEYVTLADVFLYIEHGLLEVLW
ncbi:hypothetical protein D3C80_1478680 [compost metagenome]